MKVRRSSLRPKSALPPVIRVTLLVLAALLVMAAIVAVLWALRIRPVEPPASPSPAPSPSHGTPSPVPAPVGPSPTPTVSASPSWIATAPSPAPTPRPTTASVPPSPAVTAPADRSIASLIQPPRGYARVRCAPGSFGEWLRKRKLKKSRTVHDYQGNAIDSACFRVLGVVEAPLLFESDLEQCADFCMRFWADYHRAIGRLDRLYLFDYDGIVVRFGGGEASYRSFLKRAFTNTNSWSLKRGCQRVAPSDLMPGDMFIQNIKGGIGHASMVVDACRNAAGSRLFLVGFSFMPAQEFHVERARDVNGREGWFSIDGFRRYLAECLPFDSFGTPVLKRFAPLEDRE